jgi:hypothetical protein
MSDIKEHEVEPIWKEVGAALFDAYTAACTNFIEHCDDLISMFQFLDNEKAQHELRSIRSLINSNANEFRTQADKMRTG